MVFLTRHRPINALIFLKVFRQNSGTKSLFLAVGANDYMHRTRRKIDDGEGSWAAELRRRQPRCRPLDGVRTCLGESASAMPVPRASTRLQMSTLPDQDRQNDRGRYWSSAAIRKREGPHRSAGLGKRAARDCVSEGKLGARPRAVKTPGIARRGRWLWRPGTQSWPLQRPVRLPAALPVDGQRRFAGNLLLHVLCVCGPPDAAPAPCSAS